ncbi:hypothetical protein SERLA73DRAFT_188950 [Serpula lacrymans var. lacrymans S7.3]|uniref:Uncharacterized protein n=2 Tax=Serpula lacrymans var. lacrymans TaxID=341189 RepID=F8QCH2_SERL3|nr:uncharacterized protein SERLADRAFT_479570 [Serpula lacrymans var. lacrymans S7.9]EGN93837.1 hypothetical protein SERLA73DRAFT_188950 [Serpula lacrymans var. lacrymans S7.3]EGO19206.1 hypothetical protein SERLADRAFT_479570 [Serpula lacrymans var. lacrymans S7.9]
MMSCSLQGSTISALVEGHRYQLTGSKHDAIVKIYSNQSTPTINLGPKTLASGIPTVLYVTSNRLKAAVTPTFS